MSEEQEWIFAEEAAAIAGVTEAVIEQARDSLKVRVWYRGRGHFLYNLYDTARWGLEYWRAAATFHRLMQAMAEAEVRLEQSKRAAVCAENARLREQIALLVGAPQALAQLNAWPGKEHPD